MKMATSGRRTASVCTAVVRGLFACCQCPQSGAAQNNRPGLRSRPVLRLLASGVVLGGLVMLLNTWVIGPWLLPKEESRTTKIVLNYGPAGPEALPTRSRGAPPYGQQLHVSVVETRLYDGFTRWTGEKVRTEQAIVQLAGVGYPQDPDIWTLTIDLGMGEAHLADLVYQRARRDLEGPDDPFLHNVSDTMAKLVVMEESGLSLPNELNGFTVGSYVGPASHSQWRYTPIIWAASVVAASVLFLATARRVAEGRRACCDRRVLEGET